MSNSETADYAQCFRILVCRLLELRDTSEIDAAIKRIFDNMLDDCVSEFKMDFNYIDNTLESIKAENPLTVHVHLGGSFFLPKWGGETETPEDRLVSPYLGIELALDRVVDATLNDALQEGVAADVAQQNMQEICLALLQSLDDLKNHIEVRFSQVKAGDYAAIESAPILANQGHADFDGKLAEYLEELRLQHEAER